GPVRAGGHHLEHLLRLGHGPRVYLCARAGLRGPVPIDVQGLPAAAEGRLLQPRRDPPEDEGVTEQVVRSGVPRGGGFPSRGPTTAGGLFRRPRRKLPLDRCAILVSVAPPGSPRSRERNPIQEPR